MRGGWGGRLARWLADHYFLKLTIPQRRMVVMVLLLQAIFFITMVAMGLGWVVSWLL